MPRKAKIVPPSLTGKIDKQNLNDPFELAAAGRFNELYEHLDQDKELRQKILEYLKQGYEETNIPLFAWDARALARKSKLPVPAWVDEYLDQTSNRLLRAGNKVPDIAGAFGFDGNTGNKTLFKRYHLRRAQDMAVDIINDHIRNKGVRVEKALDIAIEQIEKLWGLELNGEEVKKYRLRRNKKERQDEPA